MVLSERFLHFPGMNRNIIVAFSVVVLHIAALWAMQTGLLRRAVEVFVPAEILSELIEPPAPKVVPPPPTPPTPFKQPVAKAPIPVQAVAPQPLAIADPTPAPNAPVGSINPPPMVTPVAAPVVAAPPAPARVELPSPATPTTCKTPQPPVPRPEQTLGRAGPGDGHSVLIGGRAARKRPTGQTVQRL
jgi:protein TonB